MQLDTSKLAVQIDGNKTYLTLALGAAVVVGNHFGLLPEGMGASLHLNSDEWLTQLFTLALGGTARSAVNKVGGAPSAPKS